MAQQDKTTFEGTFNNASTGLFKDNTTGDIGADDARTLVTNTKDSVPFTKDDSYIWPFPQVTAAGTNTYTATLSPVITAYVIGQKFQVLFTNQNTTAATLAFNGLAALAITKNGATALASGDIPAGSIKILAYDGTRLQIVGNISSGTALTNGSGTTANGSAADLGGTLTADAVISTPSFGVRLAGTTTSETRLTIDGINNAAKILSFRTANSRRWALRVDGDETGGNANSDLAFRRYDDTGAAIDAPLTIDRSSGIATFTQIPIVGTASPGDNTTQAASTAFVAAIAALKQTLINTAVAITDAASMDLTAIKHTLTTSSATRTFTISYTGDDITLEVTLNATSSIFTFPATSLCVSEGVASGDNTCSLSGVSGDIYLFAIKKIGSNYRVVAKNFGQ